MEFGFFNERCIALHIYPLRRSSWVVGVDVVMRALVRVHACLLSLLITPSLQLYFHVWLSPSPGPDSQDGCTDPRSLACQSSSSELSTVPHNVVYVICHLHRCEQQQILYTHIVCNISHPPKSPLSTETDSPRIPQRATNVLNFHLQLTDIYFQANIYAYYQVVLHLFKNQRKTIKVTEQQAKQIRTTHKCNN